MLAEPFNSLLWHAAATARVCSAEIASHGSPSLFKVLSELSNDYVYLVNVVPNHSFVVSDKLGHFQTKIYTIEEIRVDPSIGQLTPPEITTVSQSINQYNQLLQNLILDAENESYDYAKFHIDIDFSDRSLQSLNLFNHLGLEKLINLNKLSVDLKLILNPITPQSVALNDKNRKILSYIDSRFINIQIQITNALIYEIDTTGAKLN